MVARESFSCAGPCEKARDDRTDFSLNVIDRVDEVLSNLVGALKMEVNGQLFVLDSVALDGIAKLLATRCIFLETRTVVALSPPLPTLRFLHHHDLHQSSTIHNNTPSTATTSFNSNIINMTEISIKEALESLVTEADECADLKLKGTDGVLVPAVRVVLALRSKVFRRMLYGDFS
jgi:hypothetical protein